MAAAGICRSVENTVSEIAECPGTLGCPGFIMQDANQFSEVLDLYRWEPTMPSLCVYCSGGTQDSCQRLNRLLRFP
jgi:hypothetical protein